MTEQKISSEAVSAFIRSRGDHVCSIRDTMHVYVESDEVIVKIIDNNSGGSATHYSGCDVNNFERMYGST
ncbi:hypothetical protein Churi_gp344 [Pseudomonas phage Churi]|nr:hypothetical protein Churi01_gp344 [Pseudomonas phage Churi01]